MKKVHLLKIKKGYWIGKMHGLKNFEIRFNDRGFKAGDCVIYCLDDAGGVLDESQILGVSKIAYVTDFEQKEGFVVFSERDFLVNEKSGGLKSESL